MSPITTIQYIEAYCCHLCSCISNTRRISLHALSIRPRIPICISRNLHAMENGASCSTILQRRGILFHLIVIWSSLRNFSVRGWHFGSLIVVGFSLNFSRKFLTCCPGPFSKVPKYFVEPLLTCLHPCTTQIQITRWFISDVITVHFCYNKYWEYVQKEQL